MEKRTKIILSILAVGVTATVGWFIYKRIKKKKLEKELVLTTIPNERIKEIKNNPVSLSNPPTSVEIEALVNNKPSTVAITNQSEGNNFRNWVNNRYPAYAKEIDLDRSGSYNNSYINKAWKKYGVEYIEENDQAKSNINKELNNIANNRGEGFIAVFNDLVDRGFGGGVPEIKSGGSFSAKTSAQNLQNSMKGWGTDEKFFFKTLRSLTKQQRIEVREYYDTNKIAGSYGTLEKQIKSEFSGKELKEALELIK